MTPPFSPSNRPVGTRYLQILATVLMVAGLLCAGMRVPDLSRPHRPKPMHRLVLKAQVTTAPSHIKQQHHDVFVTLPQVLEPAVPVLQRAITRVAPPRYIFLSSAPYSGRSPPAA